ncbi:MAG TPA: HDIG domain-containing protein [Thermoanaerobaculia bacterium]|nr:HDIG domain-containing protein [Thermoanaerobaculia bacterium]
MFKFRQSTASSPGTGGRRRGRRRLEVQRLRDRLLDAHWLWLVVLVVLGTWLMAPDGTFLRPYFEVGQIAAHDHVASRDLLLLDEATTEDKRRRAREEVLTIYDLDASREAAQDEQFARLFAAGRDALRGRGSGDEEADTPLWQVLQENSRLRLDEAQARMLARRGFSAELEDQVRALVRSLLRAGVVTNKELLLEHRMRGIVLRNVQSGEEQTQLDLYEYRGYPDDVRRYLELEVGRWAAWRREDREQLVTLLLLNTPPNISLNLGATRARQEQAATAVEPVYNQFRRGQVVARKGDQLGTAQVRILRELSGAESSWRQMLPVLGSSLLLLLAGVAVVQGVRRTKLAVGVDARALGGMLVLLVLSLGAARLGILMAEALAETFDRPVLQSARSYSYAIPFGSLALVVSLLYGRGAALLVTMGFSLVVGRMAGEGAWWGTFYVLATSLTAIYALDRFKQRAAITRAGAVVGLVGMAASLTLALLAGFESLSPSVLAFDLACALLGGVLVAAATSFLVPMLEAVLPVTTDMTLLELSDTNLPLLRRLAFEAPGTFQHSLMVASLAKAGCEAIEANAVLAYTGALYHDIGKILRPQYFIENQREGQNPHDKLAPSISALILVNHVKEGVEMAHEYRLPPPIVDAIEQHHGTRPLSFFLNRAIEQHGADGVDEHQYRYPGPKPCNKVMGVLMLADAVEAASRTLRDPSDVVLEGLLRRLFDDCLHDGQLDGSELTLGDLAAVSAAFLRVLRTIHHRRIDYPGYVFQDPAAGERRLRAVESR